MQIQPRTGSFRPLRNDEASRWTPAGIRATARPKCTGAGHKVALPRTDKVLARGTALRWEEDGRQLLAQVWSPSEYMHGYWMVVSADCASFPGEMRRAIAGKDGRLSFQDMHRYNTSGQRAHAHDGSTCHGAASYARGSCPGCLAGRVLSLVGQHVRVTLEGDPAYGRTLRWGTLRSIDGATATFDGFVDCNGITTHVTATGLHTADAVPVSMASILEIQAA